MRPAQARRPTFLGASRFRLSCSSSGSIRFTEGEPFFFGIALLHQGLDRPEGLSHGRFQRIQPLMQAVSFDAIAQGLLDACGMQAYVA